MLCLSRQVMCDEEGCAAHTAKHQQSPSGARHARISLTFVVHDVARLLEVERIDHFVVPVVFVPVEVLRLAPVSGATASARRRRTS